MHTDQGSRLKGGLGSVDTLLSEGSGVLYCSMSTYFKKMPHKTKNCAAVFPL